MQIGGKPFSRLSTLQHTVAVARVAISHVDALPQQTRARLSGMFPLTVPESEITPMCQGFAIKRFKGMAPSRNTEQEQDSFNRGGGAVERRFRSR